MGSKKKQPLSLPLNPPSHQQFPCSNLEHCHAFLARRLYGSFRLLVVSLRRGEAGQEQVKATGANLAVLFDDMTNSEVISHKMKQLTCKIVQILRFMVKWHLGKRCQAKLRQLKPSLAAYC